MSLQKPTGNPELSRASLKSTMGWSISKCLKEFYSPQYGEIRFPGRIEAYPVIPGIPSSLGHPPWSVLKNVY
jgi:hypothetical protein